MKRTLGISRSKYDVLLNLKCNQTRKKNMYVVWEFSFKYIGKEDDISESNVVFTQTTYSHTTKI